MCRVGDDWPFAVARRYGSIARLARPGARMPTLREPEKALLARIRFQLCALISARSTALAAFLALVVSGSWSFKALIFALAAAALVLETTLLAVPNSIVAIRQLRETHGREIVIDETRPWKVAHDLSAGTYSAAVRRAREDGKTLFAWSVEIGVRLIAFFTLMFVAVIGWQVTTQGAQSVQTAPFVRAAASYGAAAVVSGLAWFGFLVSEEIRYRRKQ